MVPVAEAVNIPFFAQFIDDEGRVQPNETMNTAADAMLEELARYAKAMESLRSTA
jgi:hypothetical protein